MLKAIFITVISAIAGITTVRYFLRRYRWHQTRVESYDKIIITLTSTTIGMIVMILLFY